MKCDIIALGESLKGFDFSTLTNFRIVLNNGYKYVPYDLNVWFDPPPKGIKNLETLTTNGGRWEKSNNRGIQREGNLVSGSNSSLILAVNIAINLGYKEIDIYGADWGAKKYLHFYDEEPTPREVLKRNNSNYKVIKAMWDKLEFLEDEIITFKK